MHFLAVNVFRFRCVYLLFTQLPLSSKTSLVILFFFMNDSVSVAEKDATANVISNSASTAPSNSSCSVLFINFPGDALILLSSTIISGLDFGLEDDDQSSMFTVGGMEKIVSRKSGIFPLKPSLVLSFVRMSSF